MKLTPNVPRFCLPTRNRTWRSLALGGRFALMALASTVAFPLLPTAPAWAQAVKSVNVRINGEAIPFAGQGAITRGAAVLVPLRGIFEKLGAVVKYDAATGSITAVRLDKTITLRVGDSTGFINGSPRTLPVPAEIYNGSVLVPLRFISDAFGGQIEWDPANLVANIKTEAQAAQQLPTPPANDSTVFGALTGVYPEIRALTVRLANSENHRVLLEKNPAVQLRQVEGTREDASLNDLQIGDQVVIRRNNLGYARLIQVLRDMRRGTVKEKNKLADGSTYILFTNGTSVKLASNAPVMMGDNLLAVEDIRPSETVVVRINLDNGMGVGAAVVTPDEPNPIPPDPGASLVQEEPPPGVAPSPPANPTPAPPNPTPTPTPTPTPAAMKPEVKAVMHDASGKVLRAGDTVTITVNATPGGKAVANIAGLINGRNIELMENPDAPGTYTGIVTIPVSASLMETPVTATVTVAETITPVAQSTERLTIDSAGPEIMGTSPRDGATLPEARPRIYAAYSDPVSKVDPQSVRLYLNGKDVTDKADITENFFTYTPSEDLAAGKVQVTVAARDLQGNESRREWSFMVAPPEKPVRELSVSPVNRALRSDEILTVRLDGMAGGRATFKLGPLTDLPMPETEKGTYIGTYMVKKGDALTGVSVVVNFTPPGGEKMVLTAPQTVTLAAGPPAPPIIDYPFEGASASRGFVVIAGRAGSDCKVRVKVYYHGRETFGRSASNTLTTVEVNTDEKGNWKTDPILLEAPGGLKDVTFSTEVIAVREGNELSGPSFVRFKK